MSNPARRTADSPSGELPSLTRRLDRYFERVKDDHPLKGIVPGPDAIELWSNDYLSLADHPVITKAQADVLASGKNSVFMSAAYLGEDTPQHAIERQAAAFLGTEAVVLTQSGWCANFGLVQAIANEQTPVYLDIFAHASLWEGARSAGAPIHPFRHNDAGSLEDALKRSGPGIVIVDAIYSSNGTICSLADILAVSERYGCEVIADESHSIGVCGRNGQGMVSLLGLTDKVKYRTFSLSKAFVTRGGMVAGPARIMDYFRYEARPAIFSSAVLPHEIAGLASTLEVIQDEVWRRERLRKNTDYLRAHLHHLGYPVDTEGSQVIALEAGPEKQTVVLRKALEQRGVFGAVFCSPATPKNRSIVRLSVHCDLTEHQLDRIIKICEEIRGEVAVDNWPASRRYESESERPVRSAGIGMA